MVDLATLKGLLPTLANTPSLVYFHENQFAYPGSEKQHQSLEPQMVNLYSALAANQLLFNSEYNRSSFIQGVNGLLKSMPDCKPVQLAEDLFAKSHVVSVPIETVSYRDSETKESAIPKLLWNHRWEYDKGPELLFEILTLLGKSQQHYRVAIIGQQFRREPEVFKDIHQLLNHSSNLMLENWGYIESSEEYQRCLHESDIVLSTALHDFQGLAILEAVAADCIPVLPNRLAYPEWFENKFLYEANQDNKQQAMAAVKLIQQYGCEAVQGKKNTPCIDRFSWSNLKQQYQKVFAAVIDG